MGRLVRLALLVTTCATGCAVGDPTPLPNQERAVAMIWHDVFGETREPPPIYWRRDDCGAPNGIYGPKPWCTFESDGERVGGIQLDDPWCVEVGAPTNGWQLSVTALPHELLHASIGDAEHKSPDWNEGNPHSKLSRAFAGLKEAGL